MRLALSSLIALGMCCVARPALAQRAGRASVRLSVEHDPRAVECADAPRTQALVEARLGYDPFQSAAAMHAQLRWTRAARRFVAEISIERPGRARPARRTLSSRARTCDALGDAMSLALAIAIDPVAAAEIAARPASARRAAPPSALLASVEWGPLRSRSARLFSLGPMQSQSRERAASLRWFASVRGELSVPASVPTVDLGGVAMTGQLALGFGFGARLWSARLELVGALPARVRPTSATPVDLWNIGLFALGCAHPREWLSLCGATSATLTGAASENLQLVAGSIAPGWALGARVALEPRIPRTPISLSLSLDGLGWVVAPALRLDGQALWSRSRFTAGLSGGVLLHFR